MLLVGRVPELVYDRIFIHTSMNNELALDAPRIHISHIPW